MKLTVTIPLDRIDCVSEPKIFEKYIKELRPVVISGGIKHWPAITRWTDAYLMNVAGDLSLKVKPKADYLNGESMREVEKEQDYSLSAVLALTLEGNHLSDLCYARESDLLSRCEVLKNDIIKPSYLAATRPHAPSRTGSAEPKMWIGPANTVAQLHWDPEHNLFAQVRGRKLVILVPPKDAHLTSPVFFSIRDLAQKPFFIKHKNLWDRLSRYAFEVTSLEKTVRTAVFRELISEHLTHEELSLLCDFLLDVNNCHVDAGNLNTTEYPLFLKATRYETILEPGDILFLPYFWHHYVRSLEPSISINWFFLPAELEKSVTSEWPVDILLGHLVP